MARPMGGRVPEKSKDFKGSMKRLFVNLENWRYLFIFALILAMTSAIREMFVTKPGEFDPRAYLGAGRDAIREMVKHKIVDVLGCNDKI